MKEDWIEQVRQRLNSYEEKAPEDLWESIQQQMAARQRPARMVVWRRWTAVAASVLLLLGVGYWAYMGHDALDDLHVANSEPSAPKHENPITTDRDSLNEPTIPHHVKPSSIKTPQQNISEVKMLAQADQPVISDDVEVGEQTKDQTIEKANQEVQVAEVKHVEKDPLSPNHQPRTRHRRPSFSLRSQNLLAQNTTTKDEPMLLTRSAVMAADTPDNEVFYMSDHSVETSHSAPLSFGLSLQLPLSSRLWLESGISYTYLSSSFTRKTPRLVTTDVQRLYYLGIPLQVGYNLWNDRRMTVYGSAGVQADFCVKSTLTTQSDQRDFTRDRVQFSLGADIGLSYEIVRRLSLYAQPALHYYPDNGSKIETIFSNQPLQFSIQLGLRYHIGDKN